MTQRNTGVPWRAVCNIETATGVIGSGGLVDGTCVGMPESCILTAHFVLPSADVAATATVRFSLHDEDYPEWLEATLSPDDGFISLCNADMDFSLVACCPNAAHTKYLSKPGRPWQANERVELPAEFGLPAAMPMGVAPGAHLLPGAGGRVRIWHHPHGAFQQPPSDATAIHYCRRTITTFAVDSVSERGVVYASRGTRTAAHGALLFNADHEVVGVHCDQHCSLAARRGGYGTRLTAILDWILAESIQEQREQEQVQVLQLEEEEGQQLLGVHVAHALRELERAQRQYRLRDISAATELGLTGIHLRF
jgi:hypothetical protein